MAMGWGMDPVQLLCHSYLSTGSGLDHSGTSGVVQILFILGSLFQEDGVRVGFAPAFLEAAPNATALVINNNS